MYYNRRRGGGEEGRLVLVNMNMPQKIPSTVGTDPVTHEKLGLLEKQKHNQQFTYFRASHRVLINISKWALNF